MADSPVDAALAELLRDYDGSRMTTIDLVTRVRALAATNARRSEGVDDFARLIQAVLYTPGLSDETTVNRITEIVDGHLAGVPARSPDELTEALAETVPPDGTLSRPITGDGSGVALPPMESCIRGPRTICHCRECEARQRRIRERHAIRNAVTTIREQGVCPASEACEKPDPKIEDCAGCIASWEALDRLAALARSAGNGDEQ